MKKIFLCVVAIIIGATGFAQYDLTIKATSAGTKEPLPGATIAIPGLQKTMVADSTGTVIFRNIKASQYVFEISHVGFKKFQGTIPVGDDQLNTATFELEREEEEEEEEEVIVQSTRTSRNIKNVPTRVETISMEEIDEKSNMRPSNVSMILHESTGIQVQQTSATSGNAGIRIQGLDGRYTQLLKDGFPNFGNFASGLSVLEIPPLDLKQVEIIKGPASPLFGGGAIAGVINFISKGPKEGGEYNFLVNQSNMGQTNFGLFFSGKNQKTGYTLSGIISGQKPHDVDHDDFTEAPELFEFTVNPRLFIYPDKSSVLVIGNSFTKSDRTGGDIQVIRGNADAYHRYFEENNTVRNTTSFEWQKKKGPRSSFTFKQSVSIFDRHIKIPDYHFDGANLNTYTEVSLLKQFTGHSLVIGVNMIYDKFNENDNSALNRDNKNFTAGFYIQDTWDASDKIKLETGLRIDHARYSNDNFSNSEFFVVPRVSLLIKYNEKLSSRIGAGLGYKLPTLFTEQTESMQYRNVRQLDDVKSERSYGGTADINYKTKIGNELDLSFNHMFFYTWIEKPLVLVGSGLPDYFFVNAVDPVISKGFETNLKFIYKHDFKLFLGYTFTDARARYLSGNTFLPLVPKHKFNSALIYEKHEFLKLGLEGYYTSSQYLTGGMKTDDYWEFGFMAEKLWKKFSIYINFENFTDTRQGRFKRVANDPHPNPSFDEIWTHTEGFVINGGIKLRL